MSQNVKTLLTNFAEYLGGEDAKLKASLEAKIVEQVKALETKLVDGAPEALDTFKELAEKLNSLGESGSIGESIIQSVTDLKTKLETLQEEVTGLKGNFTTLEALDLSGAYQRGFQSGSNGQKNNVKWFKITLRCLITNQ